MSRPFLRVIIAGACVFLGAFVSSCDRRRGLPGPGSKEYSELVRAFYVGLGALQSGDDSRAQEKLQLAARFAPGEPASLANLGLLYARQQDFDRAYKYVDQARTLAADNSRIAALTGLIESRRGSLPRAIEDLRKAVQLDPKNLKAQYSLAVETEREATAAGDAEAKRVLSLVINQRPNNIAALLEMARLAAKTGDGTALRDAIGRLTQASASWPEVAKQQMAVVQQAAATNPREAAIRVVFLRNTLARVPEYRNSLNEVTTPTAFVSDPFVRFVKLPAPPSSPAPVDTDVRFDATTVSGAPSSPVLWAGAVALDDQGRSSLLFADEKYVQILGGARLAFPGRGAARLPRNAVLGIDLNYDFRTDLVFAGPGGLTFYAQKDIRSFTDITRRTNLPANILKGTYTGAWAFDVDLDGDLDIVLGTPDGEPSVLRNNGDETFAVIHPFAGVSGLGAFAAADIDGDGDPDVAMIDKNGALHVFMNDRLGNLRQRALPRNLSGPFGALAVADINSDGAMDFVLLREDGAVVRLSDRGEGTAWETADVVKANAGGSPTLLVADFDNNGALDLLVGDGQIFLGGNGGGFQRLAANAGVSLATVVDVNGDGRLDLAGLSPSGQFVESINHGSRNYHWQNIRLRAAQASGDQRINSFGIGGLVEVRSGLLTQGQQIDSPLLHFGLGEHSQVDVARIIWPNGVPQGEFELKVDQEILARQRLKGSCPWLFAWDGQRMSFVKDGSPWSAALGLHINAQAVAGIQQTQEWFKIAGDALKPRDGDYDLRVTGELWETYYIDHYSLLVVDHPQGTEIFTDERFAVLPPELKIYTTSEPRPFAGARDDNGQDVSAIVRGLDRRYLDTFGRGPYQGLTRDHWVELELPQDAPQAGPLYLLASGWIHPTDATVNIAIGQNSIPQPQDLSIETMDARGVWSTARKGLGFPAGKMKTVVLNLTGLFHPGQSRRLRLRTNLEIYWDQLAWATGVPDQNRIQHLQLSAAELRYRGFSAVRAANPSSPELPDYDRLASTGQIWRDLEGYATRYGDVRELLEKIDDRIVITNAGDELRLRFHAAGPPPQGWKRDFVMIGNGWIKDGDYNTVYSRTVLPLPWHGMRTYDVPLGLLEDDPAWKGHASDWQAYHTRYVTAQRFETTLRNPN